MQEVTAVEYSNNRGCSFKKRIHLVSRETGRFREKSFIVCASKLILRL